MEIINKIYKLLKDKKIKVNNSKVIDITLNEENNAIKFIVKRDYYDEEKDKIEYFEIEMEDK